MRSLLLPTLAVLATSATASADHLDWQTSPASLPQNQQPMTETRYQERNQLADVRLDAFRGHAYIQLPTTGRPLDYLELRTGRTPVRLADVEIRFADGRTMHTGDRGLVEPFEGRVIDLPRGAAPVVAIIPHYQAASRFGRPARLEVFGVPEHRFERPWMRY